MLKGKQVEGYVIDDTNLAFNMATNKKDVPKEELISSFEQLCKSKECNNVDIKGNDTLVKYILNFKDKTSFAISMHRNYYENNSYYVQRLDESIEAKRIILNKKIQIKNERCKEILKTASLVTTGVALGLVLANSSKIMDKIVDHDNQQFNNQYYNEEIQQLQEEVQENLENNGYVR